MSSNTPAAAGCLFFFNLVSAGTHLKLLWLCCSLGNYCFCGREAGRAEAAGRKSTGLIHSDGLCHTCECKHDGKGASCPCISCGTGLRWSCLVCVTQRSCLVWSVSGRLWEDGCDGLSGAGVVVLGTTYILDSFSELLKSLLSKCFKIRLLNLMDLKSDVRTLWFSVGSCGVLACL